MNRPEIKIAIATNINFFEKTLPVIISSLRANGIPDEMIYIFNGGYTEEAQTKFDGISYYQLTHNSYEYSPLIEIVEKEIQSEYWFLMHDTCKVGPRFKELLYANIPSDRPEKIALTYKPAMSMGLYRYDYLISIKDKILQIKNTDFSEEKMQWWKAWGVPNEDYFLWLHRPQPRLPIVPHQMQFIAYENWYGTDSIRRSEYFGGFDIYKSKSNWGQTSGGIMIRHI